MIIMHGEVPQICMGIVPLEEREAVCLLNFALRDVEKYARQFGVAVHLFDYCAMQESILGADPGRPSAFVEWRWLACRDAVMSLLHFRGQMEAARKIAEKSFLLGSRIDLRAVGAADSKFREVFPDLDEDSEARKNTPPSEYYLAPGLLIGDDKITIVTASLKDRRFTCARRGKLMHCEISAETTRRMHEIMNLFYGGFVRLTLSDARPASAG